MSVCLEPFPLLTTRVRWVAKVKTFFSENNVVGVLWSLMIFKNFFSAVCLWSCSCLRTYWKDSLRLSTAEFDSLQHKHCRADLESRQVPWQSGNYGPGAQLRLSLWVSPAAVCKTDNQFCKAEEYASRSLHLLLSASQPSLSQSQMLQYKARRFLFVCFFKPVLFTPPTK